jgi:hypothetical protein
MDLRRRALHQPALNSTPPTMPDRLNGELCLVRLQEQQAQTPKFGRAVAAAFESGGRPARPKSDWVQSSSRRRCIARRAVPGREVTARGTTRGVGARRLGKVDVARMATTMPRRQEEQGSSSRPSHPLT